MATDTDEMEEYYKNLAPRYESKKGTDTPLPQDHLEYWEELETYFSSKLANSKLLEVGCGPGTWTVRLSNHIKSITATDLNESTLLEAKKKSYPNHVTFKACDAYTLSGIETEFNGGFSKDWFSHIPKSRIQEFLSVFHSKLLPGSTVIMSDSYYEDPTSHRAYSHVDSEGNIIQNRLIPDDDSQRVYKVIKNSPTEDELKTYLKGVAKDFEYKIHDSWEKHSDWSVCYTL